MKLILVILATAILVFAANLTAPAHTSSGAAVLIVNGQAVNEIQLDDSLQMISMGKGKVLITSSPMSFMTFENKFRETLKNCDFKLKGKKLVPMRPERDKPGQGTSCFVAS